MSGMAGEIIGDATAEFERETRRHVMDVQLDKIHPDEGRFLSATFATPGTFIYSYRLTSWPGHLAISGDLGECVFAARRRDMVAFFNTEWPMLDYWSGKCRAASFDIYVGGDDDGAVSPQFVTVCIAVHSGVKRYLGLL